MDLHKTIPHQSSYTWKYTAGIYLPPGRFRFQRRLPTLSYTTSCTAIAPEPAQSCQDTRSNIALTASAPLSPLVLGSLQVQVQWGVQWRECCQSCKQSLSSSFRNRNRLRSIIFFKPAGQLFCSSSFTFQDK